MNNNSEHGFESYDRFGRPITRPCVYLPPCNPIIVGDPVLNEILLCLMVVLLAIIGLGGTVALCRLLGIL